MAPSPETTATGTVLLDRYELQQVLGRGGLATTYLAYDRLWGVRVALKLLDAPSMELRQILHDEFSMLRAVDHPRLVRVHDFARLGSDGAQAPAGSPDPPRWREDLADSCLYTADFVDGRSLAEFATGATWSELREPLCDALEALRLLHAVGIGHGDVKPANVLVDRAGRGVLIDLSCARPLPEAGRSPTTKPASAARVSGTAGFIAPELLAGEPVDARADLFAVGVTLQRLFECLRSQPPGAIQRLAARLMSARPSDRPAQVDEVLELLGAEPALVSPVLARLGRLAGRRHDLESARQALDALTARRSAARVLHVAGAEGMGRSRLLRELRWLAQQRVRVLQANASSSQALATLLGSALGPPGSRAAADTDLSSVLDQWPSVVAPAAEPMVWFVDDADQLESPQLQLLTAVARLLEPTSPVLLVVASHPDLALDAPGVHRLELGPLTAAELSDWLGATVSPRTLEHLHRLSGGVPGVLRSLLQQLVSGRLAEQELVETTAAGWSTGHRGPAVSALSQAAQRALGLVALADGALARSELSELQVSDATVTELVAAGFVNRDAAQLKLMRGADGDALIASLREKQVAQLHRELALRLDARLGGEEALSADHALLGAARVRHLALGGQVDEAATALQQGLAWHDAAPAAWARAGRAVADRVGDPDVQLVAAKLERKAGQGTRALARLDALAAAARVDDARRARVLTELGACHLELGNVRQAAEQLELALAAAGSSADQARAAQLLARVLTKRGEYRAALDHAETALGASEDDPGLRADALESAGVALSFLGELSQARRHLDEAASVLAHLRDPRRQVRAYGNRALVAYYQGELSTAAADHQRAFDLAEQHGLSDQLATAALNFGTACHQAGRFAEALRSYERGLRVAVALGQIGTEAWLRYNLAKLHVDLGLFDRAALGATRSEQVAERAGLDILRAGAETVHAEVAMARGEHARAEQRLASALRVFDEQGSEREKAEIRIHHAELAIAEQAWERAAAQLDDARAFAADVEARDVEARLDLVQAELALASGRAADAQPFAERAARGADEIGGLDLAAAAELALARSLSAQGAPSLARDHSHRARQKWERTAVVLPPAIREAFWQHPRRAAAQVEHAPLAALAAPAPGSASTREQRLALLLDINRRLNSSLKTRQVLERAMDAAIELTGAERGFVLLAADEQQAARKRGGEPARTVHVAVARNLDREQLGRSQFKFSRGIAEKAIRTGEPLITADAQADGRFSTEASVHAMHLKSVVCVPVEAPGGVLGALYLDNRFQRGRFTQDDVDLLLAFANQVALALTNARLHDEVRKRNRELEAERRRVERLLAGQAAEIDRLNEEVQRRRIPRPHRFDYSTIVGSSRALDEMFALLDRVIDTTLPILIQGESGTGKELVARAIHHNSPRRTRELVAINCAAVPDNLLESELFGYERGAFTGAERARDGLVVQARGGTLFLDEIGEMPPTMQVKLLRVLQEREVQPLGSSRVVEVDFRLVCATNRRLRDEIARGRFREDLYYRLSAVEVAVPPLRERVDDIPALCAHVLSRVAQQLGRPAPELSGHALRKLIGYDWPGNVRQLEHVLTRAVALAQEGRIAPRDVELPRGEPLAGGPPSRAAFERAELKRLHETLVANHWNVARTARQLGIARATLYRRMKRAGFDRPSARGVR